MAVTGGQILPRASITLYDVGEGDPIVTTPGYGWYDLLEKSWEQGTFSLDAYANPYLEFVEGIGLTCRPFYMRQDTQSAHYGLVGGTWEQRYPDTGARSYWLHQTNATAGLATSATSVFSLPSDPHFAMSLHLPDTPPDWDDGVYIPLVRLEWGLPSNGRGFAVEFGKSETRFCVWQAGQFRTVEKLSASSMGGYNDGGFQPVWVRHLRGRVGVSLDFGQSYQWFGDGANPAVVPAAPFTVRGQGGAFGFNISQLRYYTGLWSSPQQDTQEARTTPTTTLTAWGDIPSGTAINLTDLGVPANRIAAYSAELVPDAVSLGVPGWDVYRCPVLMATRYEMDPVVTTPTNDSTTPFDSRLSEVRVEKPVELGAGTARWTYRQEAGETPNLARYRFRKVGVDLGYNDGSDHLNTVFTGYILDVTPVEAGAGQVDLEFEAHNGTYPLRDPLAAWTETEQFCLDGLTLNQASDLILKLRGIPRNSSYRIWHAWGDVVVLNQGTPENPCELLRPGETPWETLTRIQGYGRLELAYSDDGIIEALPPDFTSGTTHALDLDETDLQLLPASIDHTAEADASATRVVVTGTDAAGNRLAVWAVNTVAEVDASSDMFCPWRRVVTEELPGTVTPGQVLAHAQRLAYQHFGNRLTPTAGTFLNTGISRRDKATFAGLARVGIPDATEHVIAATVHHYQQGDDGLATLETQWGLRRL